LKQWCDMLPQAGPDRHWLDMKNEHLRVKNSLVRWMAGFGVHAFRLRRPDRRTADAGAQRPP
jgi:hypothetical protein